MGHKHLTEETKAAVIALYKAGKSPTEIANILPVGKSTVDKLRIAAGIAAHNERMSNAQKRVQEIKHNKAVAPVEIACDPTRAEVTPVVDGNSEKEVVKRILCNLIDRLYDEQKAGGD